MNSCVCIIWILFTRKYSIGSPWEASKFKIPYQSAAFSLSLSLPFYLMLCTCRSLTSSIEMIEYDKANRTSTS